MSKLKAIPAFEMPRPRNREFGKRTISTDYVDWSKTGRVRFPDLKPSTTAISIRPAAAACWSRSSSRPASDDVPHRPLIKMWQAEKAGPHHPEFEVLLRAPVRHSYRVSFLYFIRCGMMESWPSRRILSFS